MTRDELIAFVRAHDHAVEASVAADGAPQAAVIGVAASDELELVFDTLASTRKSANLKLDPRIALVIGWDDRTVQLQGVADLLVGADLERLRAVYLEAFPDGRDRLAWPGIEHWRVRPTWARHSDFRGAEPNIVEVAL